MNKYTEKEISYIKKHYNPKVGVYDKIAKKLNRTPESIRKKCRGLGLSHVKETSQVKPTGIRTAIVLPDMQVPYHDEVTMKAVEKYIQDNKWDYYINLGDFLDLDLISSFNERKPKLVENKRLQNDFELGREILTKHRDIVGNKCEMYLIQGNHENRITRYIEQYPQLEGVIEVENNLDLDKLNIKWIPFWDDGSSVKIGEATFIHGRYTNKYHTTKHADSYGTNIFYGHVHDVSSYSKVLKGKDSTIVGQSMGCLCEYEQQYKKGSPDNWQQAFGVFHFFPNGYFNYYIVRIFDNRFIAPDGKVYDGKKIK